MDGSDDRGPGPACAAPRHWPPLATLGLLLVISLLNNALAPGLYLAWACFGILGLLLLAQADGLSRRDWGFGPMTRRAALAAAGFSVVIALGMLLGTQLPGVEEAYRDDRVVGMAGGEVAFAALVRVPIGTALLEELAFRGVLLAMLARRHGRARAVLGSCLAFGVWHLLPAAGLAAGNQALGAALGPSALLSAAIGIGAASLVGALLCLARIRYDHLVVPWAMHATANGLAYLLAWIVLRP